MADADVETLLRQNREADLLRFSTAGSVDDGKSTLIGRLLYDAKGIYEDQLASVAKASRSLNRELDLALLTDGLRAEREQGITIDVAYRYFSTPRRRFIIADTPGHEQYTRNMATGASTADLAIVLIDATRGVLTQSKRHGFIASLLAIPHVVVAVNKMDLVDYDPAVFERICKAFGEFAARLRIPDLAYIPMSALRGDNVVVQSRHMPWYHGVPLLQHLETVYIGSDRNLIDLRFPVQYVNRPNAEFRGYCGQVASGVVRVGDEVMALPSGGASRVRAILTRNGDLECAFPPQSVTLCLEDNLDISRGDMLVHRRNLPNLEREVEAMLVWLGDAPMQLARPYLVKHTTNLVRGQFSDLQYRVDPNELHRERAQELRLNEIGRVVLELYRPIACDEYARNRGTGALIVIDPLTNATVAAGMIIERARHRTGLPHEVLQTPVSRHIARQGGEVTPEMRARLLGQRPVTVWLTGLSGAGKSSIAFGLERALMGEGHACCVLDGDNIRHGLNRDLGFSPTDRTENIRRVAEVAHLMNEAGLIVVTAFISPYRADRVAARSIIGAERLVEVFVDAPLGVCEGRDPRGLYAKARAGEIAEFTGINAPYEAPEAPDLHLMTAACDCGECVRQVLDDLRARGLLRP